MSKASMHNKATLAQITQVVMWRTEDGKLHTTKAEANAHSARLTFMRWYQHNPLFIDDEVIRGDDITTWLNDNRTVILEFLLTSVSFEIGNDLVMTE